VRGPCECGRSAKLRCTRTRHSKITAGQRGACLQGHILRATLVIPVGLSSSFSQTASGKPAINAGFTLTTSAILAGR
jgi:hypothetical protein